MLTRTLIEQVQMLKIFWDTQLEVTMKLKPTTVLEDKDIVSIKEATSATGQSVGMQSIDAQDVWKSFSKQYMGLMKLREQEVGDKLEGMLFDIYGLTAPLESEVNEEPGTLSSDEGASRLDSES